VNRLGRAWRFRVATIAGHVVIPHSIRIHGSIHLPTHWLVRVHLVRQPSDSSITTSPGNQEGLTLPSRFARSLCSLAHPRAASCRGSLAFTAAQRAPPQAGRPVSSDTPFSCTERFRESAIAHRKKTSVGLKKVSQGPFHSSVATSSGIVAAISRWSTCVIARESGSGPSSSST